MQTFVVTTGHAASSRRMPAPNLRARLAVALFLFMTALCPVALAQRPPVLITAPQSQLVVAGANVGFAVVVAPSSTPLTYQWSIGSTAIAGATGPTLALTNVALAQAGSYSVTVDNGVPPAIVANATLAVASSVIQRPSSVSQGGTLTLYVSYAGVGWVRFQWQFKGRDISEATDSVLIVTNAPQFADATAYALVVTNAAGSLTVRANLAIDPTFTKITTGPVVTEAQLRGAGASWGDYNNDGFIDLFVGEENAQGNRLYRNNGDGTFTNITSSAKITDASDTRATLWGDYDNDGYLDLFVSNAGGVNLLYHNNGDGTFTRITNSAAGPVVTDIGSSYGASWGDYDNDGFLDLFVASPSVGNVLYHNNGGTNFSRASAGNVTSDDSFSLGPSWGDLNNDGLLDLFVANLVGPNFLYLNFGGGVFQKITTGSIVTDRSGSLGCAWGDYDNDGFLDLFVANDLKDTSFTATGENHNFLYHNNGDGTFTRVTNSMAGPIVTDPAVSMDCAWGDYDNDGWLDLFVANADGPNNYLYHNKGDGTFERITTGSLANDHSAAGYGSGCCTWGDYDNDGFLDLFAGGNAYNDATPQVNYLYRNNGNTNGWLKLKLEGTVSNRAAIGAKVRVLATIRGKTFWQMREISGGGGYHSQSGALLAHFGLGDATNIDRVRIEWPSGTVQEMTNVAVKQFLTVREPPRLQASVANGVLQLTLKGGRGFQYQIDTSSDLTLWSPWQQTTITNLDGTARFTEPVAADVNQRFYRAVGQ